MSSTFVYYTNISNINYSDLKLRYSSLLSKELNNRADFYIHDLDKVRYCVGRLLVNRAIKDHLPNLGLDDIEIDQFGRPYIKSQYDFNLSHSEKIVVCIISNCRVGIDVERIRNINFHDFKSVWTKDEWIYIKSSKSTIKSFYELWTRKEAVIKGDGRGMYLPLDEIDVIKNPVIVDQAHWFTSEIHICSGYVCHLACIDSKFDTIFKKISF